MFFIYYIINLAAFMAIKIIMKECIVVCVVLMMNFKFGSPLKVPFPFNGDSNDDTIRIPFLGKEDLTGPLEHEYRGLFYRRPTVEMFESNLRNFRFRKGQVPSKTKEIAESVNPMILGATQSIKKFLKVGLPSFGIPRLDPLTIRDVEVKIKDVLMSSKLEINNLEIKGFSNFEIEVLKIDYSNYTFYFAFVFPLFQIDLDYVVKIRVVNFFPLTIGGHVNWISRFIDISGVASLQIEEGIELKGFDMNLDVKENKLNISRIFGLKLIDRSLSWMLNKFANIWFNMFKKKISTMISDTIYKLANKALKGISLTDLLFFL